MSVISFLFRKIFYYVMDKISPLEEELDVEFTQFMFPTGSRSTVWIARPTAIALKARRLGAHGFKFEIENSEGTIWMSCIDHESERHVDRYCDNGVDVPKMVDELIEDAYSRFIM